MAWWSDIGKKVALAVFDEKTAPLEARVMEIEKDHRMMLHRIEANERKLRELEERMRALETTATIIETTFAIARQRRELPPPLDEGE